MRRERLADAISDTRMAACRGSDFEGNVTARVSARRKKVRMNGDVARSLLNQGGKPFIDVGVLDFQKGRLHQIESTAPANAEGSIAHIFICFSTPASVPDHQDRALPFRIHAWASATAAVTAGSRSVAGPRSTT